MPLLKPFKKIKYDNNNLLLIAFENYLVNSTFAKYDEYQMNFIELYSFLSIQFSLLRLFVLGLIHVLTMNKEDIVKIFQVFEKTCSHNSKYLEITNSIISSTEVSKAAQAINIIMI